METFYFFSLVFLVVIVHVYIAEVPLSSHCVWRLAKMAILRINTNIK